MRRERSKKETDGEGGGVMGKGTNLQTLSRASTTFCPRIASHLWVSRIPDRADRAEWECGRAEGWRVRVGGRRQGGIGGREVAGKRLNIFFKVKNLRNVSENNLAAVAAAAAWGRRDP